MTMAGDSVHVLETFRSSAWLVLGCALGGMLPGCQAPAPVTDMDSRHEALRAVFPSRIEIVEPFTRVKSFDDDKVPDGIELFLQGVNALGDSGLRLVGSVRVELYKFVPGSGDRRGQRLEHWEVALVDGNDQRTYWNSMTRMYEFRLGIDASRIPPARRFVLVASYESPFGDRFFDSRVIEFSDTAVQPASVLSREGH